MKYIKSLALVAFAVAATAGFSACQSKGTVSSSGVSASTTTTSTGK